MKRLVTAGVIGVLCLGLQVSQVWADDIAMATATGSQEVTDPLGGIATEGTCQVYLRLMPMVAVKYTLECWNITGVTQAHIHVGRSQENGGVVVFLFGLVEPTGEINGTLSQGMFTGDDIVMMGVTLGDLMNLIQTDGAYLNVHTDANPAGEVRGQVTMVQDKAVVGDLYAALATGSQEIAGDPPNLEGIETDASCMANFRVVDDDDGLKYKLKCWNITGVVQAHIHLGKASENGPNVVFLFDGRGAAGATSDVNGLLRSADGSSKSKGTLRSENLLGELSGQPISALVEELRNDNAYINVHTEVNAGGEVRGQITFLDKIGF